MTCPECGGPVKQGVCQNCGWTANGGGGSKRDPGQEEATRQPPPPPKRGKKAPVKKAPSRGRDY